MAVTLSAWGFLLPCFFPSLLDAGGISGQNHHVRGVRRSILLPIDARRTPVSIPSARSRILSGVAPVDPNGRPPRAQRHACRAISKQRNLGVYIFLASTLDLSSIEGDTRDNWLSVFPVTLACKRSRRRVTLRPITKNDATSFTETVLKNREMFRDTIPWLAETEAWLVRSYIAIWEADQQEKTGLHLLIEVGGQLKGVVNMHTIDWDRSIAHLGYWLSADAQGLGIATEAVSWVSKFGIHQMGLDYLDISTRLDNTKSRGVAERAGYTLIPEIQDYEWVYKGGEGKEHDKIPLSCYIMQTPFKVPRHPLSQARLDNFYSALTSPTNRINLYSS
ncbi:hypothetical protein AAMO2058_000801900 [Amorphochlora amoebiformis]